jgi:TetR/AcrR family transcriptional regulator
MTLAASAKAHSGKAAPRKPAAERRTQLIDVAIGVFARKGFGGATTKEIAVAAGVTEAIIFRHFATKQDLYKAILDSRCTNPEIESWFADTQQFMDRKDDEGLFRHLISKIIASIREDPRFERLMLHAALEGHEIAIMYHNQFALPIGKQLIEYISKRQRAGAIRACDSKAVIFAIAGAAHYYAHQKYLYQSAELPMPDEAATEAFLDILMHGLGINKKKRVN